MSVNDKFFKIENLTYIARQGKDPSVWLAYHTPDDAMCVFWVEKTDHGWLALANGKTVIAYELEDV